MLKGVHPLINADVLYALRAMGHGDDLIICDTNFPADSVARQTRLGKLRKDFVVLLPAGISEEVAKGATEAAKKFIEANKG